MWLGAKRDPWRIKNSREVPPRGNVQTVARKSPCQRKNHAQGLKRLGYRYQVAVISTAYSSAPLKPKDDKDDLGGEEGKFIMPTKAPPEFEEGASYRWAVGGQT